MVFKKIKVYIHVAKMNSWEAILLELLEDIRISKLNAEVTLVSVGGDIPEFKNCRVVNTGLPLSQFEFPTLELLYDEIEDETAICYAHLKGVSVPDSLGHRFWRRELSEFVFINWKQRIHHLSINWTSGPRITNGGAGWRGDYVHANKHYSGNFWWARSDYLKTLIHPSKFRSNRYAAEAWLGQSVLINEPIN
jgi:hypothetical protein